VVNYISRRAASPAPVIFHFILFIFHWLFDVGCCCTPANIKEPQKKCRFWEPEIFLFNRKAATEEDGGSRIEDGKREFYLNSKNTEIWRPLASPLIPLRSPGSGEGSQDSSLLKGFASIAWLKPVFIV
jgi:hypothetical protein